MKKLLLNTFVILNLTSYASSSLASEEHKDEHGHEHDESSEEHKDEGDDHHDGHDEGDSHGHEEASAPTPDKGITEKSEHGFKLSPEAIKTMEIQMKPAGTGNFSIEKKTLVLVKDEKSVFRVRDNWIKRVPVQVINRSQNTYTISSSSLKEGDQIVTQGTGFLRIAEVFATEGASHGHSH